MEYKRGQWAFGDLVRLQDGNDGKPHIYGCGEVFAETIGQYTGLTDKNGTKVFEGDIVFVDVVHFPTQKGVVTYTKDFFGLDIKDVTPIQHCIDYAIRNGQVEVIGNIHDNPELLKVGEGDNATQ